MQISLLRTPPNHSESTDGLKVESMATGSNGQHPGSPSDHVQSPHHDDIRKNMVSDLNSPAANHPSSCGQDKEISVIETGTVPLPMYIKEQCAVMEIEAKSYPMDIEEQRTAVSSIELPEQNFMSSDVDNLFNGGPYYPDEDECLYCPEEEKSQKSNHRRNSS